MVGAADGGDSIDSVAYPFILFLFSGPARDDDVVERAHALGLRVLCVDVLRGGYHHDVHRASVRDSILHHCRTTAQGGSQLAVAAHIASPCRSFSPLLNDLSLRSKDDPLGSRAPPSFSTYIRRENALIDFAVEVATLLLRRALPVTWENPPPLDDPQTDWYWAERAHLASLWHMPAIISLTKEFGLLRATAAMCMFGSPFRKYFSVLASASLHPQLAWLDKRRCPRTGAHMSHPPAMGVDADGGSRAARSGHYPGALIDFLLCALAGRQSASVSPSQGIGLDLELLATSGQVMQSGSTSKTARLAVDESEAGFIASGFSLDASVANRVNEVRKEPAGFSSLRYLQHASVEELMQSPLPDVRQIAAQLAASSAGEPSSASGGGSAIQWDGIADWHDLAPGAPNGKITLGDLIPVARLTEWSTYLAATQAAFDAIRAGRPHRHPGDFVIREEELPRWARGLVWNTEDPHDCRPVTRSTRHTSFPGVKQFDRERLRHIAKTLRWEDVDPDIVDQACEGGFELRSGAQKHITAVWHHSGVVKDFSTADATVRFEREQLWTRVSSSPMPFVPSVFSPRDVVWQERSRLEDGKLTMFMKPRVTHDMSAVPRQLGGRRRGDSINSAIPSTSKALPGLPRVQQYARAQAVCSLAGGGQPSAAAGVYGVDETKAYSFGVVQTAEWYTGCYLWPDDSGRVRPHVSLRMVFGGGSWPNRFERLSLMVCAWIQARQREFDRQNPYPPLAEQWRARRAELQQQGVLPPGEAQTWPAGMEPYIDDFTGRALQDTVVVPPYLQDISIGEENTEAIGATAAARDSRVAVHCRIAAFELRAMGAEVPDDKTMCGTGMVALGVQLDATAQCVRCPEMKRLWLLHAVDTVLSDLERESKVSVPLITKLTGRLTNLSQFFPELRRHLAVGYALSRVRWRVSKNGARWPLSALRLRPGSRRVGELQRLLETVATVAQADVGVSMAPPAEFPPRELPGTLTVVTDASRADVDDGCGGYAFMAGAIDKVFVMSTPWDATVKAALDAAAVRRSERTQDSSHTDDTRRLSMPAAETLAAVALATAVARELKLSLCSVVAIGDCAPAARALSAMYSPSPQIRHILEGAYLVSTRWLGVSVPRELNTDADILSHPSRMEEVVRKARGAGLHVIRVAMPEDMWGLAVNAARLPLGADDDSDDAAHISVTTMQAPSHSCRPRP